MGKPQKGQRFRMSGRLPASHLSKPKKQVCINPYKNFLMGFPSVDSSCEVGMWRHPSCFCLGTRELRYHGLD